MWLILFFTLHSCSVRLCEPCRDTEFLSLNSIIIIQRPVCTEHFVPFYIRSTAEGFLYFRELSAAVQEPQSEKTEDVFTQWAAGELQLGCVYSVISPLFSSVFSSCYLPALCFSLPTTHLFLWHPTSEDYYKRYKCAMCNFPLFLLIENLRNALLGTFTNVSASPPLSSTCTDTKCQHLSSVTVFANCSHLEMSMGKP